MTGKKAQRRLGKIRRKYDQLEYRLLFVVSMMAVLLMELIMCFAKGRVLADTEKNIKADGCVTGSYLQNGKAEQEKLLRMLPYVKETGEAKHAGALYYDNSEKLSDCIVLDSDTYKKMYLPAYTNVKGAYPKGKNEIMCSKKALHDMGIDHPHLGMKIKTDFEWNNLWNFKERGQQTFQLCGYFTEYANERYDTVFISRAKLQAASEPYFPCDILIEPSFVNLDGERLQDLLERQVGTEGSNQVFVCNDSPKVRALQAMYGGYIQSSFFIISLVVCIFLLVYNVLWSFLTENIRQYGLLELLGASRKQIKKMICRRIFVVAVAGCLVGNMFGAGVVITVLPHLLKKILPTGIEKIESDLLLHSLIPVASNILVFLAFLIPLLFALRKIDTLTPIEAYRCREENTRSRKRRHHLKKIKKPHIANKVSLMQLAKRNVMRQKSKFILVVLSISLGGIVLLTEIAIWKGFNQTEKIRKGPDVTIAIDGKFIDAFNNGIEQMDSLFDDPLLSEEMVNALLGDAELTKKNVAMEYGYLPTLIPKEDGQTNFTEYRYIFNGHAAIIRTLSDDEYMQLKNYMKKEHIRVNLSAYDHHMGVIITHDNLLEKNPVDQKEKTIERIKTCKQFNDYTEESGMELMPCGYVNRLDNQFPIRNLVDGDNNVLYLFVSKDTFQKLKKVLPLQILRMQFKLDKVKEKTAEIKLERDIADINEKMAGTYGVKCDFLKLTTKTELLSKNQSNVAGTQAILYIISLALIAAGLLNYYSTLRSHYIVRKKEYRTYDNLGMGKVQMRKLLLCEGLVYFYAVCGITVVFGASITFFAEYTAKYYTYDFSYNCPIITLILIELSLLLLCVTMTNIIFYKIHGK